MGFLYVLYPIKQFLFDIHSLELMLIFLDLNPLFPCFLPHRNPTDEYDHVYKK